MFINIGENHTIKVRVGKGQFVRPAWKKLSATWRASWRLNLWIYSQPLESGSTRQSVGQRSIEATNIKAAVGLWLNMTCHEFSKRARKYIVPRFIFGPRL
jgi:hypothetical protein